MNKANFSGSTLDGMVLDQVWAVAADFSGASLNKANLFASQMQDSKFDGADLSGTRITADLSRASLRNAKFKDSDSTLRIFVRLFQTPAQKIDASAMMRTACSTGAAVRPKGPNGIHRSFQSDQ